MRLLKNPFPSRISPPPSFRRMPESRADSDGRYVEIWRPGPGGRVRRTPVLASVLDSGMRRNDEQKRKAGWFASAELLGQAHIGGPCASLSAGKNATPDQGTLGATPSRGPRKRITNEKAGSAREPAFLVLLGVVGYWRWPPTSSIMPHLTTVTFSNFSKMNFSITKPTRAMAAMPTSMKAVSRSSRLSKMA